MTNQTKRRAGPLRYRRFLLLLCLGVTGLSVSSSFPAVYAAADTPVREVQAVSVDALGLLAMETALSPESLQDFTQLTIRKLSAAAPFTDWKDARTEYYPLGPGTHSWLVNVMDGQQRIGYLIISATAQGGYMLSEYGAGTSGLPYSLTDLRQLLVQEELISATYSGKLELSALYAPLLPVWKLTLDNTTVYINASVPQILPWSAGKTDTLLQKQLSGFSGLSGQDLGLTPQKAWISGGQDDPYADLAWLTSPGLKLAGGTGFVSSLAQYGSLAFQSSGRNDILGAPFMITGYQSWNPGSIQGSASPAVVYAASGPKGKRYLPLSVLQQSGTLHRLTVSGKSALGAAAKPKHP